MSPLQAAIKGIRQASEFYLKDLDALTDEQVLTSAGGSARRPVDFTWECGLINRRIAARVRGEDPGPFPGGQGFPPAPDEYQDRAAVTEFFRSASQELIDAAEATPDEEGAKLIGAEGHEEPLFAMVTFAAMHTMYHDAQLNFIQSLAGDSSVHWF